MKEPGHYWWQDTQRDVPPRIILVLEGEEEEDDGDSPRYVQYVEEFNMETEQGEFPWTVGWYEEEGEFLHEHPLQIPLNPDSI